MVIKIFLISILILIYFHILVHLNINKNNTIEQLNEISNIQITNQVLNKQPFYFNGEIIPNSDLSLCTLKNNIYHKIYDNISILEPNVKFFPKHQIYLLNEKKHLKLHDNKECRNFYKVTKGIIHFICIHPKYKSTFTKKNKVYECNKSIIQFMKQNNQFIHIILYKNSVLFIPNYWLLFGIAKENSIIEKIQYSTILNQSCFILDKIYTC